MSSSEDYETSIIDEESAKILLIEDLQKCGTKYSCSMSIGVFNMFTFAEYLAHDTTLLHVNIGDYHEGLTSDNFAEEIIALGDALRTNKTLKELDLSCNTFNLNCLMYLVECLADNTTLESLNLDACDIGGNDAILFYKINVRELSLSMNNLSTNSLRSILGNTNIQSLNLYGCEINNEGAEIIAEALEKDEHLFSLNIGDPLFSVGSLKKICDSLRDNSSLKELLLPHCNLPLYDLVAMLEVNTTLKSMDLDGCIYTNEEFDVLQRSNLEILDLSNGPRLDLRSLKDNTRLISFTYNHTAPWVKISKSEAEVIANIICENTTLRKLHIRNFIEPDEIKIVSKALRYNNTLEKLKVFCNHDMDYYLDKLVFPYIEKNYTIKKLSGFGEKADARLKEYLEERMEQHKRLACTKRAL